MSPDSIQTVAASCPWVSHLSIPLFFEAEIADFWLLQGSAPLTLALFNGHIYIGVDFLVFHLLVISWASWICDLVLLILENSQSSLFRICLLYLFSFWHPNYIYVTSFVIFPQFLDILLWLCFLIFFFFLSLYTCLANFYWHSSKLIDCLWLYSVHWWTYQKCWFLAFSFNTLLEFSSLCLPYLSCILSTFSIRVL